MPRYEFDMNTTLTKAAGAAVSGVGRFMVAAHVNPAQKGLPVAKSAYWFDGLSALAGLALVAMGQGNGSETMELLGEGLMLPGVAGLTSDLVHDVNRKWNPEQPKPAVPTQVMQVQSFAPPADPLPDQAGYSEVYAVGTRDYGGSEY